MKVKMNKLKTNDHQKVVITKEGKVRIIQAPDTERRAVVKIEGGRVIRK